MTTPAAYVFIGSAGSGKSSIARLASARLGATYLDKDTLVTPLTELLLSERGEDPLHRENNEYYRERVFPAEYRALMNTAADNLSLGLPVVLDAPFFAVLDDPAYFERARAEAEWPRVRVVVVDVRTSEETLRRRIMVRGRERDAWKLANWDEFWAMMRDRRCTWRGVDLIDLDNDSDPLDEAAVARALGLPAAVDR